MKVPTSLLIAIFQLLLNCAMADWDLFNPIVLVDTPTHEKVVPRVVRQVNGSIVYYNEGEQNTILRTYAYCPNLSYTRFSSYNREYLYCNYFESHYTYPNQTTVRTTNLPTQKCPYQLDYQMIKTINPQEQHQSCSYMGRRAHKHRFVYWLCEYGIAERIQLKIYEVCYDDKQMQMLFGIYIIYSQNLLGNPLLAQEQNIQFEFDKLHHDDEYTERVSEVSPDLYYIAANVSIVDTYYVPRFVLPPEWLAFGYQRRPLYHHANTAPMNSLLKPIYDTLMMDLKDKLSLLRAPIINVIAGVLGEIHDNQDRKLYVGMINGEGVIPLPKIFWALIYNEKYTDGVVIMMDNELLDPGDESYYDLDCGVHICISANLFNVLPPKDPNAKNPNIYCCPPRTITVLFSLRSSDNKILRFP